MSGDLRRKIRKTVKRAGEITAVRVLVFVAVTLPRRIGFSLFTFLGTCSYRCYRKDTARAHRNLARAFPGTPEVVVDAMVRGAYKSIGHNGMEALRLTRETRERVLESCIVEGEEHLRRAYASGRGVVVATGHIGCWERLAAYFSDKGYKVNVIAKRIPSRTLDDMLTGMRRRHGVETFYRGENAYAGYRTLKRGEILGMLVDHNINTDGMMAPFFGRPAWTTTGPALFAIRSGAAVVPMAIHLQPSGMHHITVLPEIEHPPEDLSERERIEKLTLEMTAAVERLIRIYPQQWTWFHDRWHVRKERLEKGGESEYLEMDGTA